MHLKTTLWTLGLVVIATVSSATAQTDVSVRPAELAAGFGSTKGELVMVADQLVFVDSSDPDASFAIARSNIERLDRDQDVVTVALRTPVRNQRQVMFRLAQSAGVTSWFEGTNAGTRDGTNLGGVSAREDRRGDVIMTFQAQHDHLIGSCVGRLIVMEDRLAFESLDERNDSRQWVFADISELTQDGIYQLKITPFLGNEYNLDLIGKGMDSAQYRDLVDRIADARAR